MRVTNNWQTREVLPSAARTTSGGSAAFPVGGGDHIALLAECTATGGTPSLTISVEWSHDGSTWFQADPSEPMTAITAAGQARARAYQVKGTFARVWFAISGTSPSLTFSVQAMTVGD